MISFDEFCAAYRVFANDGEYSGGTPVVVFAPWETPVKWHDGLTQLPDQITEQEVLDRLKLVDTILVTCTDKDMISGAWEMESMAETRNVLLLSVAGGVIQARGTRHEAMSTIADWLCEQAQSGKMPNLARVTVLVHNEVCGAVKSWNQEESVTELVHRMVGKEASLRGYEENLVMTALARPGAEIWRQFEKIPGMMFSFGLYDMQRDGMGKASRIRPLTVEGTSLTVEDLQDEEKIKTLLV